MKKIFIDGKAGTTGLRIYQRLEERNDVKLISLSEEQRKDISARQQAINESDVTFLCLPDDAARESVSLVTNPNTVIIDASTAHRTEKGWLYGFSEVIEGFEQKVKTAKRIAVPGCHASGFIALVKPLIDKGILNPEARLCCTSVTGYSGGGKKMIADYTAENKDELLDFPRQYGLNQNHKHLREMKFVSGVKSFPAFSPIVAPFYSGMEVTVPLDRSLTGGTGAMKLRDFYAEYYKDKKLIKVMPYMDEELAGFVPANLLSGRDDLRIFVGGNEDRITVSAVFDNLGKGASGAAIQNMNLMFGLDETAGLNYCETDFI